MIFLVLSSRELQHAHNAWIPANRLGTSSLRHRSPEIPSPVAGRYLDPGLRLTQAGSSFLQSVCLLGLSLRKLSGSILREVMVLFEVSKAEQKRNRSGNGFQEALFPAYTGQEPYAAEPLAKPGPSIEGTSCGTGYRSKGHHQQIRRGIGRTHIADLRER